MSSAVQGFQRHLRRVDALSVTPPVRPALLAPERVEARVALGEALISRAPDVASALVAQWAARFVSKGVPFETLEAVLAQSSRLGTELIGRYLATGRGATPEEARLMAERSSTVVVGTAITTVTKNYLQWRDETLRVVAQEAQRLGSDSALVEEVTAIVRYSADSSVLAMNKQVDLQREELQRHLDDEREKLTHLALHDPLTGLANRTLLMDRLAQAVAGVARRSEQVGVLYLDLDGFKAINDRLGHAAGDRLLVAVAARLSGMVRPSDTVARVGGDEFVIVCADLPDGERSLEAFAQRLLAGVAGPLPDEADICVSVSIGGTVAKPGEQPERIVAAADAAMYDVKERGRALR